MDDWKTIKGLGNVKPISKGGTDSTVFSFTRKDSLEPSSVVKLYDKKSGIVSEKDKDKRKEIYERYYADTLKAVEILEGKPNPLNQSITINGVNYPLRFKVVPQGKIILENIQKDPEDAEFKNEDMLLYGYKFNDETGRIENAASTEKIPEASFGQKFVGGLNFSDLITFPKSRIADVEPNQRIFINNSGNRMFCGDLEKSILQLFDYLSKSTGLRFSYSSINVKPFVEDDGTISIYITDLSGLLKNY